MNKTETHYLNHSIQAYIAEFSIVLIVALNLPLLIYLAYLVIVARAMIEVWLLIRSSVETGTKFLSHNILLHEIDTIRTAALEQPPTEVISFMREILFVYKIKDILLLAALIYWGPALMIGIHILYCAVFYTVRDAVIEYLMGIFKL